jgi:hypothetical protein
MTEVEAVANRLEPISWDGGGVGRAAGHQYAACENCFS